MAIKIRDFPYLPYIFLKFLLAQVRFGGHGPFPPCLIGGIAILLGGNIQVPGYEF